jgi:hypothetical protein
MSPHFLEFFCLSAQFPQLFLELIGERDKLCELEQDKGHCEKDVQVFVKNVPSILIMGVER